MAYTIEISINLQQNYNDSENTLYYIADKYNYDKIYKFEEIDGNNKIARCHSITVISFLKNQLDNLMFFIKNVKQYKCYNIECIYEDDIKTKLIYASDLYLKYIDKDKRNIYTIFKRSRAYSEQEILILKQIKVC
jgi:hypothetical protein